MEEQVKPKYMDKQSAMSFVIKALYFPKPNNYLHAHFQGLMNYEDVLFTPHTFNTLADKSEIVQSM